jgi:hypothetical protein
MFEPLDIYKLGDTGSTVWVDVAWTVEDARASVKEMMLERPGEYVIFNKATRDWTLIKPGDEVA